MPRRNGRKLSDINREAYAEILRYGLKHKAVITRAKAAEIGRWQKQSVYYHLCKMAAAGLLDYQGYNTWTVKRTRAATKAKSERPQLLP